MKIYVFDKIRVDAECLDDCDGKNVSLHEHLRYIYSRSGTPDVVHILNVDSAKNIPKQYLDPKRYVLVEAGEYDELVV